LKVFIDTSAFCAITIPGDQHNAKAKSAYKHIQKTKSSIYTSDYVLDEVYTLLKSRSSHFTAIKFMDEFEKTNITILHITEEIEKAAKKIFRRFEEKRLSFTDCTSFSLINAFSIETAFAFDDHFRYHPYSHPVTLLG